MAIMLVAPLLFERFRLPGIVGLILAGVVVGPHGLGILEPDSTIILLGTVGLLFLSHTLLALPVVNKLGIMRTQAVTATLGGTLMTNVMLAKFCFMTWRLASLKRLD